MLGLCWVLLLRHACGACIMHERAVARLKLSTDNVCWTIIDCYFDGLHTNGDYDKSGGAIKFESVKSTATVDRCTFRKCWAKSSNVWTGDMGGALFVELKALVMNYCCAKECWCFDSGQFIYVRKGTTSTISQVTVLDSPWQNEEQQGTINFYDGHADASNINISNNTANFGCGIYTGSLTAQVSTRCRFLTVDGNTGNSVIYCWGSNIVFDYCNFVNNHAVVTFILIANSVSVSHCLFRGNLKSGGEFARPSGGGAGAAVVTNCTFDSALQTTDYLTADDNYCGTENTTIKMCHLNTRFCVAVLPCDFTDHFSASEEFMPSTNFSDSDEFTASSAFAATQHFTETQLFSPSSQMTESEGFTTSDHFTASVSSPTGWFSVIDDDSNSSIPSFSPAAISTDTETAVPSLSATSLIQDSRDTPSLTESDVAEHVQSPSTHKEMSSQAKERTTTDEGSKSNSLALGAIIGIIVGILLLIVVLVIVIIVVIAKRRKANKTSTTADETNNATELETENTTADTQWESMTEINPMFADTMDVQMNDNAFERNLEGYPE